MRTKDQFGYCIFCKREDHPGGACELLEDASCSLCEVDGHEDEFHGRMEQELGGSLHALLNVQAAVKKRGWVMIAVEYGGVRIKVPAKE